MALSDAEKREVALSLAVQWYDGRMPTQPDNVILLADRFLAYINGESE